MMRPIEVLLREDTLDMSCGVRELHVQRLHGASVVDVPDVRAGVGVCRTYRLVVLRGRGRDILQEPARHEHVEVNKIVPGVDIVGRAGSGDFDRVPAVG